MSREPLLTAHEAATYVSKSYRGFDHWVRREGVHCTWIGRERRFTYAGLDAAMRATSQRPAHQLRAVAQ